MDVGDHRRHHSIVASSAPSTMPRSGWGTPSASISSGARRRARAAPADRDDEMADELVLGTRQLLLTPHHQGIVAAQRAVEMVTWGGSTA